MSIMPYDILVTAKGRIIKGRLLPQVHDRNDSDEISA